MAVDAGDGDLVGVTALFLGPSGDWRRLDEQSSSEQNVGITDGRLGSRYPQVSPAVRSVLCGRPLRGRLGEGRWG